MNDEQRDRILSYFGPDTVMTARELGRVMYPRMSPMSSRTKCLKKLKLLAEDGYLEMDRTEEPFRFRRVRE